MLTQQLEDVPVTSLIRHPENPRRGDTAAIVASIQANGWYGVVVAQRSTRHVLVGNHRLDAARQLGMETVPVMWVDCDDERARRILLVDNRANDLASYDTAALVEMLERMLDEGEGLTGTGYGADDLDDLMAELERIATTDPEPFEGGYSASEEEVRAAYGRQGREGRQAAGLREVILVVPEDDYDEFVGLLRGLARQWGTETTGATVLRALREASRG